MPTTKIILLIALIILVAVVGVYAYLQGTRILGLSDEEKAKEEEERLVEERYPDVVKGIINFAENKITIKTDDGKEYSLWPTQPRVIYERQGITNGQQVEIRGKILEGERILVKTINSL